jgi:hypothetical protein
VKKMVNYYPANAAGPQMWTTGWDPVQIAADFARIAALGANTVRIFVHPSAIGYPVPDPDMLLRVEHVVDIARAHGLRVHLTLFDLYPEAFYEKATNYAPSKTWAKAVLAPFVGDPALACVELHNEIPPDNPIVMAWVKVMLPYIRKVGGHPVTVSYTSTNAEDTVDKIVARFQSLVRQLDWAGAAPDFWDFHYYGPASSAVTILGRIKGACRGMPLYVGETGQSTYGQTDPSGKHRTQEQAEYNQAQYATYGGQACHHVGLDPPGWWMLNDTGKDEFGLYRTDGTAKPSAAAVETMFRAAL